MYFVGNDNLGNSGTLAIDGGSSPGWDVFFARWVLDVDLCYDSRVGKISDTDTLGQQCVVCFGEPV